MTRVKLQIERLEEQYCGKKTGNIVFHVSEWGCTSGIFLGCPLGRDYTEETAIKDFIYRANADDASLKLKRDQIQIFKRNYDL